jgi:hypothetical protein
MSERDPVGYAGRPPHPRWPRNARIAVRVVLDIEEGAESCTPVGGVISTNYRAARPARGNEIRTSMGCTSTDRAQAYGASGSCSIPRETSLLQRCNKLFHPGCQCETRAPYTELVSRAGVHETALSLTTESP